MTTLFISDLHLSNDRPEKLDLFYQFLKGPAQDAEALYILGDLFEALVGDDDDTPPNPEIFNALSSLSTSGIDLFVMAGNRDFLMGKEFERKTGAVLLPDPHVIDLYGEKTLMMVRNPEWQQQFLDKSLQERLAIAQQMRAASKEAMQDKIPVIMDAEQETVEKYLRDHNVSKMIHGHTHRPAIHDFILDNSPARRTVLGDWYQNENVLVCNKTDQQLTSIHDLII